MGDAYIIPTNELTRDIFRLLDVDTRIVVPFNIHVRILISSADVLHAWTVPSLGKLIRIHLQSTFFTYVPKTFACFSFKFILACCTQLIDLSSPRIVTHYFAKKPLKKYFWGPGGVPRHMHGDFEILGSEHLGGSNDQAE